MSVVWERTAQTKAPLSKVIEYYMNPEVHVAKVHPNLVNQVKILSSEHDTVTWEQHFAIMGMNPRSVVRSSLDRATNSIQTQSVEGSGKGTSMIRTFKAIPTGTEVHFAFSPKLGALGFLLKGRARRGFEKTVDEDLKALDGMA